MSKLTPTQQKLLNSISSLKESTIDDLEKAVNEKWGSSQFDWTIGRVGDLNGSRWFWYCGTTDDNPKKWLHHGYSDTISEALQAMLDLDS